MMTAQQKFSNSIPVRVMSYNVHRCLGLDRVLSPQRVAEVIATGQPDIVALQEVDVRRARSGRIDQAEVIARDLGMNLQFFPALTVMDELYGDAILTRLPARLVKADHLPVWRGREPRGAIWAAVQVGPFELQVINTHLGLWRRERLLQIEALLGPDWTANQEFREPGILLGDFNTPPRSHGYRRLVSSLADAYAVSGSRPESTFPTRYPLLRLDYIFVSRLVDVINVGTVRTPLAHFASDHLPVMAELELVDTEPHRFDPSTRDVTHPDLHVV
jgi:endonuclease/exonuclease/phosphatase family metal-dependent hydrolase